MITDAAAVDFLHRLVAVPSTSGDEAAAVTLFVTKAQRLGFSVQTDAVGNGIAVRGNGPIEIVLLGHIDTVPGRIPVRLTDGVLHGRGSVDAKGPLAALLFGAARARISEQVRLIVIAAVGEETPHSPGATYVRDRLAPAACIIGEPSGCDGVTLGYKGRLLVEAACTRPSSHTAGPEASPADLLCAWWSAVLNDAEQRNAPAKGLFDRLQASIRSMHTDSDGLADSASMTAGFRLPPGLEPAELEAALTALTAPGISLRFAGHTPAHATDRNDPVVRALSSAIRAAGGSPRPKLKTGTADLNIVGPAWKCPIAAYGPGDSALDHTPEERIEIAEYLRSIDILADALSMLGRELTVPAESRPAVAPAGSGRTSGRA